MRGDAVARGKVRSRRSWGVPPPHPAPPVLSALLAAIFTQAPPDAPRFAPRGGLPRFATRVKRFADVPDAGPVRVAFLGGSITEGHGYRPLVERGLRDRFPGVGFEFVNAGVASTGSTTGLFRFRRDALSGGGAWDGRTADLVLVDFAVNDDQDERLSAADAAWSTEGIARTASAPVPAEATDLLFVHFPNDSMVETLRHGDTPVSIAAHERVAGHYGIPTINVAAEVADRIDAGTLTWERYGGTHPGPEGHALAAGMILDAIDRLLHDPPAERRKMPAPLRPDAVHVADLLTPGSSGERFSHSVRPDARWHTSVPDWAELPGRCRERFADETLLWTTEPGAALTLTPGPHTTALALSVLAGPDAGAVDVTVGDGDPRRVELFHPFSETLHYPRTVLLYRGPALGEQPVTVRAVTGERGGAAVRVVGVGVGS